MAEILDTITIGSVLILRVDGDPSAGGGTVSDVGTVAIADNGAGIYYKYGAGDTLWSKAQPLNAYLTSIAGLTPSNNDVIQLKSGAWANRTLAQLFADLSSPSVQSLPSNPTPTTSVTRVHQGTGATGKFTPAKTGNYKLEIQFDVQLGGAAGTTSQMIIAVGTVASGVPANGAAETGTVLGKVGTFHNASAGERITITLIAVAPGLVVGTEYWYDLTGSSSVSTFTARNIVKISKEE